MTEVKVKIGYVTYTKSFPNPADPDGPDQAVQATGDYGDVIDVNDHDLERLEALDAITDADEELPPAGVPRSVAEAEAQAGAEEDSGEFDASEAGDDELVEYLRTQQPNVSETVALAGDDPDLAQRLIDAETALAAEEGGEPRKGVIDGLERIAD